MRVAINGFGRIGRTLLRILATDPTFADIEVVAINDIAPPEACLYLFRYDSVFGPFPGEVSYHQGQLTVAGRSIAMHTAPDLSTLDLQGVDVVLECTGHANTRAIAARGLKAGAGRILISGPSNAADITALIGVNACDLGAQSIVSNGSCTTNALVPLIKLLDDAVGVGTGHMTTIHCYTNSQPVIDRPSADFARGRAAALSMVPTTTSAARLIDDLLPHLAGRIEARAVRVPTASVSAIDLVIAPIQTLPPGAVLQRVKALIEASPIMGWVEEPLVSSDLRGRSESVVICGPELSVSSGGLIRLFGWYDNEWGFSTRMLEMARLMTPDPRT